jgi:hypothetical protein
VNQSAQEDLEGGWLLKVRRFVLGIDEADWLKVQNAVFAVRVDIAPMSVEEMRNMEKSPDFDSEGRFIGELDNKPVGIVHAYVDKLRRRRRVS